MTEQHPVTPPPELLDQWCMENNWRDIAIQAARWGADMELEAMLAELKALHLPDGYAAMLRAARRPKPPTLKEQALALVSRLIGDGFVLELSGADAKTIRRALEQLPD